MAGSPGWGTIVWRSVLMGALLGAVTWFFCVVIPPLSDWAQETATCRGAETIERDVRDGGTVGYGTKATGSTVFTLRCTYPDGTVETVGNDRATVAGFAFGFLVGFVTGTLVSFTRRTVRKLRSGRSAAPGSGTDAGDHAVEAVQTSDPAG